MAQSPSPGRCSLRKHRARSSSTARGDVCNALLLHALALLYLFKPLLGIGPYIVQTMFMHHPVLPRLHLWSDGMLVDCCVCTMIEQVREQTFPSFGMLSTSWRACTLLHHLYPFGGHSCAVTCASRRFVASNWVRTSVHPVPLHLLSGSPGAGMCPL